MTWGHDIVEDGWAGAASPHPHPTPLLTQTQTQKASITLVFPLIVSCSWTDDGRTAGRTDGRSLL